MGGGAVFFAFRKRIEKAILSDANEELVAAYRIVKRDVDDLIQTLRRHARRHFKDDDYYYEVRESKPTSTLDIAARFIYLNRAGFNGKYEVTRSGNFTVAKGRQPKNGKPVVICDEKRLRKFSQVLDGVEIKSGDFSKTVEPSKGDFIYCDPPYDGGFVKYTPKGFSKDDQRRLRDRVDSWVSAGAGVISSNSDTPYVRELYGRNHVLHLVAASRKVNPLSDRRGRTSLINLGWQITLDSLQKREQGPRARESHMNPLLASSFLAKSMACLLLVNNMTVCFLPDDLKSATERKPNLLRYFLAILL